MERKLRPDQIKNLYYTFDTWLINNIRQMFNLKDITLDANDNTLDIHIDMGESNKYEYDIIKEVIKGFGEHDIDVFDWAYSMHLPLCDNNENERYAYTLTIIYFES